MKDLLTYSKQLIKEQSEELIIEESKKNPQKFEPLYNKYYPKIFRLVLNKVGYKSIAAELTSNVFFKAFSNIKKFKYKGLSIYVWFYRIALNECNEYFRKEGSKRIIVLDNGHYETLSEEMAVFGEEYREDLKQALKKLKETDLQIIEMRFFDGLKFKDISEVIGITEAHSKVRLYRAVERLRKYMRLS